MFIKLFYWTVLFCLLATNFINAQTAPRDWGTAISHDRIIGDAPHVLQLQMVSEGDSLIGQFALEKLGLGRKTADSPFIIEGHKGQDGTFWPNVQLEVKIEPDGKWLKVASSLEAPILAKLSVYNEMVAYGLYVDLNAFKAHFGKYHYGRVVLKSGENTVISLKDLEKWSTPSGETKK